MKAINQRVRKHLPHLPPVAGRLSKNIIFDIISQKATVSVCLLLFCATLHAQGVLVDTAAQEAYHSALNLDPAGAMIQITDKSSVSGIYVTSLTEALELLITEDHAKFNTYEDRFLDRLDKKLKSSSSDYQFLQAEIRLHWAFVYLKFGHEFDAALRLREAYQIAEACRMKFPEYLPIRKTSGLLQVMVGSVPDKYNWILSLLSMRGSVSKGMTELKEVADSAGPLSFEGKLLHALVQGFILSKPQEALKEMRQVLMENEHNRLVLFLSASLALKSGSNEIALEMLTNLSRSTHGIPLYYADYLRGEAFLHKGDYARAVNAYRWFIDHQPGQNYIKDAHYKIGLCHLLDGNQKSALAWFTEARSTGKESTEADKSAARSLSEAHLPNVKLSKVRYLTDGGYYREADALLLAIEVSDFSHRKDEVEYSYRKARLAHKMNRPEAIDFYLETVKMAGDEDWYFAPNACLQLGYIYQSQDRIQEAVEYFKRALTYRRHPYKNSIDSKARSALAQLGRM